MAGLGSQGLPPGTATTLKPWETERRGVFEDQVLLLEQLGAGASSTVNTGFYRLLELFRGVFCPKFNGYERSMVMVLFMQQIASPHIMVLIAKYLQVMYEVENFLLLLSVGSLVPFLLAFRDLVLFIPCPQMAAIVSNTSIMIMLAVLLLMGWVASENSLYRTYIYTGMVWPLWPIGSMIARQYITRDKQVNQFSPITTLPFLAMIGVSAHILAMVAAKKISVTDYLIVTSLDLEWAALFASMPFYFGIDRFRMHFLFAKYYLVHLIFVGLYFAGQEVDPDDDTPPVDVLGMKFQVRTWNLCLAAASRGLHVMRSIMLKVNFAQFNSAESVSAPLETYESLFATQEPPRKHRFARFPGPVLLTLDAAFDSGLADSEMHGVGPLGTHDLFILTDFTYMLPLVSIASYVFEAETLQFGFQPPDKIELDSIEDQLDTAQVNPDEAYVRIITPQQQALIFAFIVLFGVCYSLQPTATSKYLFSRGSSIHTWKWRPVALSMLPFFVDVFFLNIGISKVQMMMAVMVSLIVLELRSGLWTLFKRKYLAILTKELHYHMPSTLRGLQKKTLLEFLNMTNTDDFEMLLLETCIYHGNNIREFTRQTGMMVYDPRPSATAAWKLATSIVMKALKHEKKARKEAKHSKVFMVKFIKELVGECAYKAVELADGHGARLKLADIHARQRGKVRALNKLRLLVTERRGRRRAKQTYLSNAPVILAATGGAMRSVSDVTQPSFGKDKKAPGAGAAGDTAPPAGLPGPEALSGGPPAPPRGLRTLGLPNIDAGHLPGLLSAVLGFGADAQGQLGLHSATGLKTHVMPIDELRSRDFVQVVCGGCCTFFVSDSGKVLGSGSNRSLEIGFRMEIAQVETPQIIKGMRAHKVVQLSTSPSSLGQAHTLALTSGGDVYAFGTSNCGALGLEHFTQSFPEPIRMTHTVPMIQVACGGRHSLFLAETGEVYATGDNRYGQLGIPGMVGTGTMTKVEVPSMRMVTCGENHSLAVLSAGGVFSWGANSAGQCGLEHVVDVKQPARVRFPMLPKQTAPFDLVSISGGSQHTLVAVMVGPASFVLGCGSNVDGQLGLGAPQENGDTHFLAPFPIGGLAGDPSRVIVQVACAGNHSLVLARTGEAYAFGSNRFGQLGYLPPGGRERASSKVKLTKHDGVSNLWEPTRIDPLRVHHVRYVSTSDRHSMVIAA